ncbi:MAG: hypothetical protein Ct9H300mP14_00430 [Gammaproteobacteria bacterium]|nr:MAG: hypothetical protein Ct9H300mP14_00430 [Gammaproteobacteria bacterium]
MSLWPDNELTARLDIRYPIIQAPMAGASTPALAIAVSTTGGLGSLGLAMHTQEALRNDCATVSAAGAPYNANFFVHNEPSTTRRVLPIPAHCSHPTIANWGSAKSRMSLRQRRLSMNPPAGRA